MVTTKRKPDFKPNFYEKEAWKRSELVCGIDEVGRSCFSGPVVAAAAILRPKARNKLIKDSKLMTSLEREIAFQWLMKNSSYGIGIVHHRAIDVHNIYQATLIAMKRALMQLLSAHEAKPSIILVDAMPVKLEHLDLPVVHFIYGERQSQSIAAASIIAKVTRDALMTRLDTITPGYAYSNNKGYGTEKHRQGIMKDGVTLFHRMSFAITKEVEDVPLSFITKVGLTEREL
jgi:ribonuclease HII